VEVQDHLAAEEADSMMAAVAVVHSIPEEVVEEARRTSFS
jgi:hypothetical protein